MKPHDGIILFTYLNWPIIEDQRLWLLNGLTVIPICINNRMLGKVLDEITYLFLNVKGCNVQFSEWISNVIEQFIRDVITYSWWVQN